MNDLVQLVTNLGLPAALVIYWAWQAWVRESRLANRVTTLETFIGERFSGILSENTAVLARVAQVLERTVGIIDRLEDRLEREHYRDNNRPAS